MELMNTHFIFTGHEAARPRMAVCEICCVPRLGLWPSFTQFRRPVRHWARLSGTINFDKVALRVNRVKSVRRRPPPCAPASAAIFGGGPTSPCAPLKMDPPGGDFATGREGDTRCRGLSQPGLADCAARGLLCAEHRDASRRAVGIARVGRQGHVHIAAGRGDRVHGPRAMLGAGQHRRDRR